MDIAKLLKLHKTVVTGGVTCGKIMEYQQQYQDKQCLHGYILSTFGEVPATPLWSQVKTPQYQNQTTKPVIYPHGSDSINQDVEAMRSLGQSMDCIWCILNVFLDCNGIYDGPIYTSSYAIDFQSFLNLASDKSLIFKKNN